MTIAATFQLLPDGTMLTNDMATTCLVSSAADQYRQWGIAYPKFFKMDPLCQWAFLGAEALMGGVREAAPALPDPTTVGLVLATTHGCLTVDKAFLASLDTVPSPALFVYTLPNIMLGEISIRHGFKGEQLCLAQGAFDEAEIMDAAQDLLDHRGMQAVLAGYVDEVAGRPQPEVRMWWLV